MLRGFGRSQFGARGPASSAGNVESLESLATGPAAGETTATLPAVVPPAPPPPKRSEGPKEVDPAQEQYEALKRHIHTHWSTDST